VPERDAGLGCEPLRHEQPVARLRFALDAQKRRRTVVGQELDHRCEVGRVEDLRREAVDVLGRELGTRPLADAGAVVLPVLQLAQLRRRRELRAVLVRDPGLGERVLEASRSAWRKASSVQP
jgi:hypothetical protein